MNFILGFSRKSIAFNFSKIWRERIYDFDNIADISYFRENRNRKREYVYYGFYWKKCFAIADRVS